MNQRKNLIYMNQNSIFEIKKYDVWRIQYSTFRPLIIIEMQRKYSFKLNNKSKEH